jgi:outer membrane protein OmpA-like peptidoglycan-associated protein
MALARRPRSDLAIPLAAGLALAVLLGSGGCASAPRAKPAEKPPALTAGTIGRYLEAQKQEIAAISKAKVVVREERLLVTFPSDEIFESGLPRLSEDGQERFGQLAQILRRYPESDVAVRGYTDSLGSEKANQHLSQERAGSVSSYLVTAGVAASRVKALGFGEQYPVASNDTDDGREKNRRVEIEIIPIQDSLRGGGGAQ